MNATGFGRILWKEYRSQRALWMAVVLLTFTLQCTLLANAWLLKEMLVPSLFSAALVFAALYALGTAATLFAAERENGTYDLLRSLPVVPRDVVLGKLAFAIGSTAAMYLVTWALALALARGMPDPRVHPWSWAFYSLSGIELLTWGILFSLLLQHALTAAILAGTVESIILGCCLVALSFQHLAIPGRLLIVALVTVADFALAARWFRERLWTPAGAVPITLRVMHSIRRSVMSTFRKPTVVGSSGPTPSMAAMLGRLVWQELRQSAALSASLIAMLLPLTLVLWASWLLGDATVHKIASSTGLYSEVAFVVVLAAIFAPSLLGSSVFLADQTRCRFLTERGIPPRLVWLSRQIRALAVAALGLLLVLPLTAEIGTLRAPNGMLAIGCLLGFVAAAYCCGQLCSMFFRSGIIAATCGMILTILLCGWAAVMFMLGLSWLWSAAPLLLAFVAATWLHAPNWLVERRTWRAKLRPALVIAAPALAILAAIPLVRVYEIPAVELGFDPQELTRPVSPEEEETLALYARAIEYHQQAMRQKETPAGESARREADTQAVALAIDASRRPLPELRVVARDDAHPIGEFNLADLVLASGKTLQAEGKLDAALDHYVAAQRIGFHACQRCPATPFDAEASVSRSCEHALEFRVCGQLVCWAAQSGQKSACVLKALRTFDEQWHAARPHCSEIKCGYLMAFRALQSVRADMLQICHPNPPLYFSLARWLPWERVRAIRLLNKLTAEEFAHCQAIEGALTDGFHVASDSAVQIPPALLSDFTYNAISYNLPQILASDRSAVETCRRVTQVVLALEAWKLDHGRLPASLDDLKGKYLSQIPGGAAADAEFRYEPKGVPYFVAWCPVNGEITRTIEPGQPFVGCGPVRLGSYGSVSYGEPGRPDIGLAAGKTEFLRGGWVLFPIP